MAKQSSRFSCTSCGAIFSRWQGQCTTCSEWNSLEEEVVIKSVPNSKNVSTSPSKHNKPIKLNLVQVTEHQNFKSGLKELDRVLGQGIVAGSVVLLGGEPGVGKSTLALQISQHVATTGKKVLYVSGEESEAQVYLRSSRVGDNEEELYIFTELDITKILGAIQSLNPDFIVLDSIQVVYHPQVNSVAGSVNQVRQCAQELISVVKSTDTALFLIGHITKDGSLAGPKVLEHMVDAVLFFEGERNQKYRMLRCFKNRYSNTQEVGIFEMKERGLVEIENPSGLFVDQSTLTNPGSVISAVCEGSRVILVEIQALVVDSGYGMAKRTFLGVDQHRGNVMISTLEKSLGFKMGMKDVILNIIGGLKVTETALDLGMVAAMVSSFSDRALKKKIGIFGEVGLTGEVRSVPNVDRRLKEFEQMGFDICIFPSNSKIEYKTKKMELKPVSHIREMVAFLHGVMQEAKSFTS